MKTILHISKYYYPHLGGIEATAMSLAEGMSDYQNVVVCFSSDGHCHKEDINGVEVYRVSVNASFMNQDISFTYRKVLKELFVRYKPDFCHLHCPNPFLYPLMKYLIPDSTKLVLHWHSDILSKGMMYRIIKPFENAILKRADAIIATSPDYIAGSKQLSKYNSKIHVGPNGINTYKFNFKFGDEERIKEIKSEWDEKPIVFFAGRHVTYKGIDCLLRAEKHIKGECVILIAGTGPETPRLRSFPCSERVKFLGRLTDDDLKCYMYAADIFAFPSRTRAEAFGIAMAEAMYCHTAPVTFAIDGSGVNWVSVAGETGEQAQLGNMKAFAAAIDKLLYDRKLLKKYQNAAHKRIVDYFTEEIVIEEMLKIYSSLCNND